jgi:hypothetical protein
VAFLLLVRPSGSSVGDILAAYSQRYGYPRPGLTRALQATWYKVLKVCEANLPFNLHAKKEEEGLQT